MKIEPCDFVWSVTFSVVLAFAAGCWIGADSGRYKEHTSAVKAGVGEYVVDSSSGDVSFVWKVCK